MDRSRGQLGKDMREGMLVAWQRNVGGMRLAAATVLIFLLLNPHFFVGQSTVQEAAQSRPQPLAEVQHGVVIESVGKNSAAETAGMRPGDILLRWTRSDHSGIVESPFDVAWVELEQNPRGSVRWEGLRGDQTEAWTIGADHWGLEVRPNFSGKLLSLYRQGVSAAQEDKWHDADARWREIIATTREVMIPTLSPWLLFHEAEALARRRQWTDADPVYQEAIEQLSPSNNYSLALAQRRWASTFQQRGNWPEAGRHFQNALKTIQSVDETLLAAALLTDLGVVAEAQGDLRNAEERYRQGLDIRQRLAPLSMEVAESLTYLGVLADEFGGPSQAEAYFRQALTIDREKAPSSITIAFSFNNLGILLSQYGDLTEAERDYDQALAVFEKLAPGGPGVAHVLNNLGDLEEQVGDGVKSAQDYRQALAIYTKLNRPADVANVLSNLGNLAADRGDLLQAERYDRQALQILEKLSNSLDLAEILTNLGKTLTRRGAPAEAEQYFRRALEIEEKAAPAGLDTAASLQSLGDVARQTGKLDQAEGFYRRALALRQQLTPGSMPYAETVAALAKLADRQGQPSLALPKYAEALGILNNRSLLAGYTDEVRAGFRAKHASYYKDFVDLLVRQNQTEQAIEVLESSRARSLLEFLMSSHIAIRRGVDQETIAQQRSLRMDLKAKSAIRTRLLTQQHSEEDIQAVDRDIERLASQYRELEVRILGHNPGYAALTQPASLTLKEIQQELLDNNTLLLTYSLSETSCYLFAVSKNSLHAYSLPKAAIIEARARLLYRLLGARSKRVKGETVQSRWARIAKADKDSRDVASALSRMLLKPVAAELGHKRLVIVSDGALQYLPFSALPEPDRSSREFNPLIADHEIVNIPSASVMVMLRREAAKRGSPSKELVILADPVFDPGDVRVGAGGRNSGSHDNPVLTSSARGEGFTRSAADFNWIGKGRIDLPRLAFSRREADAIASLVSPGQARKALDFEASRQLAISGELSRYRVVHFATHALVDNRHPELSGLVLSLVNAKGVPQDGFLDLQDIYNLDLGADLVVLSACDTALGRQLDGEGMIGLTRGFLSAGASRVVASLWNVDDSSTAKLMKDFYQSMEKGGAPPARALRLAQLAMWKQQQWSAPFYWAGFTLQGEWK
jgi:CHAT domain-containing protein